MNTRRRLLLAALAASLFAVTLSAQTEGWQGKPFQQWTNNDVKKLLNESPWAQTVAQAGPMVNFGSGDVFTPDKIYRLRLRSALTVRQGLLRFRQLEEKYDQMSDKKKAEFDEKNKALIECPACPDNYVLSLLAPAAASTRTITLDKMKLAVRLMDDRGRERPLVHVIAPKSANQEIVFFFPRFDEKGEPLLTPASKKVVFTIDTASIGLDPTIRRFEFDVSRLLVDGKVEF